MHDAYPHSLSPEFGATGQGRMEPEVINLHQGWARLTTDLNGEMSGKPLHGFFAAETQFVTRYRIRVNGRPVKHRFSVLLAPNQWSTVGSVIRPAVNEDIAEGEVPEGSLDLRILRTIQNGWVEDLVVTNNSDSPRQVDLELQISVLIGDMELEEEMKKEVGASPDGLRPLLHWEDGTAVLSYSRDFGRRTHTPFEEISRMRGKLSIKDGDPVSRALEVRAYTERKSCKFQVLTGKLTTIRFRTILDGRAELPIVLRFEAIIDGFRLEIPKSVQSCEALPRHEPLPLPPQSPLIQTPNSTLNLILNQAMVDLESLRLPPFNGEAEEPERFTGFLAGIPRYMGVFGRDILTTAWQAALFGQSYLEPALNRVAAYRGARVDPWRDEEPGRLPHELRLNPHGALGKTNRFLYYGDVTSTPFWIIALATAWHWSGDRKLLERQAETLNSCLKWLERRLDEGMGFIFYAPADPGVPGSNRNQAWKDSGDAIVNEKGQIVGPPLAVAEVQGYAYQALRCAAEIQDVLGNAAHSQSLLRRATRLQADFERTFWMEEHGTYALALDSKLNAVPSVASNAGHCLGTGIIADRERQRRVVESLLSQELFSGWGIRTLSSKNPAYDPYSYHRGAVWPVENATIAASMALCGFQEEANRVIGAQLALATLFRNFRLPEAISGHERSPRYPTPGVYPWSNPLQAWSVSAILLSLQCLLGIRPAAPLGLLRLSPHLPEWMSWVTLHGLRVGDSTFDLRFWRENDGTTRHEVLSQSGSIHIERCRPGENPESLYFKLKAA